jgi:hypothetical protein
MAARHGARPGVAIADKALAGVTCIRLDGRDAARGQRRVQYRSG